MPESILQTNLPPSFLVSHSLAIRVWHWLTFAVLTASLVMVLLASTMFSMKANIPMVTEQVQNKGGTVTAAQARAVAHEYNDKLWMMHKYLGYWLCGLLLARIVIEVAGSKEERLAVKIKDALRLRVLSTDKKSHLHYLSVKYGYVFFYLVFLAMAMTGLGLAYEDVPFLRTWHRPLKQIHEFSQYLMYLYIGLHLIGVIWADARDSNGIVSGMIHGKGSSSSQR